VIHHLSHESHRLVCREYPAIADKNHIVIVGWNYELLLPTAPRSRSGSRQKLGLKDDENVFLVLGALRNWNEVRLLQKSYMRAKVSRKRLIMAARYSEPVSAWKLRFRRWALARWQRSKQVVTFREYVPDQELYHLFDAADTVIVVRENAMSSGVPSLAMTFGRMVIAPRMGCIPEFLGAADNILFDPLSESGLSHAMERSVNMDREAIGKKNSEIASKWKWGEIIRTCLGALCSRPPQNQ
jgi:beta-1,4-mannosyltransferase